MNDLEYRAPTTLAEAIGLLAESNGHARVLAGGTDLIVQLREGLRSAGRVVDVKRIPEMSEVHFDPEHGLRFGASTPCFKLYEHPEVIRHYPALVDATRIIGAWQIQSRASVGGNLCNSSPAADTIPALIAYGATAHLLGPHGARAVKVEDFCTGPGKNVLQPGEVLVSLELPMQPEYSGGCYQRFIPRNEMDIAVVGAGSALTLDAQSGTIIEARIGLGAVAPTPLLAEDAMQSLIGKPATEESFAAAGDLARQVAKPISDMRGPSEYRVHLVGVLVKRTLGIAADRARGVARNGHAGNGAT